VKQGEIWDINLSGLQGKAIEEKCSVIIINDDTIGVLPSRVIVPLTHWQDKFDKAIWLIRVDPNSENNLDQISAIDAFQMHTIPTTRFLKKVGTISVEELQSIKNAVKAIINTE